MTVVNDGPAASGEVTQSDVNRDEAWHADTTSKSVLHWLGSRTAHATDRFSISQALTAYWLAATVTYGLMLLLNAVDLRSAQVVQSVTKLAFLRDMNTAYLFLCSFPTLVLLTISDDHALRTALNRVQRDGVVTIAARDRDLLQSKWQRRFARVNMFGQLAGVTIGTSIAIANYVAYSDASVGFWATAGGHFRPVGYAFLASVWLFYATFPVYVIRTIYSSLFLADVVRTGRISMMPFHPDKAGGLRPVGTIGLRNQYGLTVFGLNIVMFAVTTVLYLGKSELLIVLVTLALVAYLIMGPVVFLGPLLPFRAGMLRSKSELMSEVAQRLRVELHRLRTQLPSGPITGEDEALIDRLRKVGAIIDELPVWPFDAGTLRRFVTAYLIPFAGALVYPLVTRFIESWIKASP
jgi:hypothetical protein